MKKELRRKLEMWLQGLDDPDVEVVALFGSAATGRLRPDSDLDLYVRLRPGKSWDLARRLSVASDVSRLLGREVDLVVEDEHTSTILRRQVAQHGQPLWERRPGAWIDLQVAAVRAYTDLEPYLRRIGEATRERWRQRG
jgi:predicted nucleotidyltransferase